MFLIPTNTPTGHKPLIEMLGIFPAILLFAALGIGVAAVIARNNRFNIAAFFALVSIGFFGFGTTAWRLFIYNRPIIYGGGVDPAQSLSDFGIAWMPTGLVLPACGVGIFLLSISWLLTKNPIQKKSEAEIPQ
jgi:hypothetical protein